MTAASELCRYRGDDTQARLTNNDDNTWFSRCHCMTITCASGTYDEALTLLDEHRQLPLAL